MNKSPSAFQWQRNSRTAQVYIGFGLTAVECKFDPLENSRMFEVKDLYFVHVIINGNINS